MHDGAAYWHPYTKNVSRSSVWSGRVLIHPCGLCAQGFRASRLSVGAIFGDIWQLAVTHHHVSSSSSEQSALQFLLPWFYTCRLDVPFDAVPAALELCQQAVLTELVDEANLALNSEGTACIVFVLSTHIQHSCCLLLCQHDVLAKSKQPEGVTSARQISASVSDNDAAMCHCYVTPCVLRRVHIHEFQLPVF